MRVIKGESIWIDFINEDGLIPDTMTGKAKIVALNGEVKHEIDMSKNGDVFEMRIPDSITSKLTDAKYRLQAWVYDDDGYSDCLESQEIEIAKI